MSAIERQRYIIDFTVSSLQRRKGRNIALVTVYAFMIFLLASVLFFVGSLKMEAFLVLQNSPEIIVQKLTAGRQDAIPLDYMAAIKEIRGVQEVEPRFWGYYHDALGGATYTLMATKELEDRTGEIIIGTGVGRRGNDDGKSPVLRERDILPFKTYDGSALNLSIAGLLPSTSELVTADLILVSEADFRAIFSLSRAYATDLVLTVRNAKERPTIAEKISQLLPDSRPILRDDILRTYETIFDWRGGMIIMVLSGAFLAFIILAWDKATGLSAEEKREIGILKAIGWETADVLLMKFWEGAMVSLTAFFIGIFFAYVHVFLGTPHLFEPVLKGWSTLYPSFRLTPYISVYQIATLFFLTVIPYTVVTILPSWRVATIDPDSVMRI